MPYCSILECKNDSRRKNLQNGGISYHRFPNEPSVKEIWIDATGRNNWMPTKLSTICSEHFFEDDFLVSSKGYRYTKPTACPSIKTVKFCNQSPVTMDMVEVDPKLFITCRLCLDEMGQYQIVPQVQMQIKYCFDIEVEPFDSLPQLICKKCQSILSRFAGIKQTFQEKQKSLTLKLKNSEISCLSTTNQQQQDTVSSTQHADSDSNSLQNVETSPKLLLPITQTYSTDRDSCKENTNVFRIENFIKTPRPLWKKDYIKHFVCRFCTKSYKDKRRLNSHLRQCNLKVKYSNVVRKCLVQLDRIDTKLNLTSSNDNVVCKKERIIHCKNKNYYVLYALKSFEKDESSSDENFTKSKKEKRRRLISHGSNETLVIEGDSKSLPHFDSGEKTSSNQTKVTTDVSDIECVDIDDSDSVSSNLKASSTEEPIESKSTAKLSLESEKVIQNVITMCYNKFLKRLETNVESPDNLGIVDFCLERKILSMGQRFVTGSGLISTGLIRYMEHRNLDVNWIEKIQTNVGIKVFRRDKSSDRDSTLNWRSLKDLDKSYISNDFIDCFEKAKSKSHQPQNITNSITQNVTEDNVEKGKSTAAEINNVENSTSELHFKLPDKADKETQKMLQLLNENPVANPKQLKKKSASTELLALLARKHVPPKGEWSHHEENVDENSDNLTMPIITSTISLANSSDITGNDKNITQTVNNPELLDDSKTQTQVPRIKVKPVAELMSDKALNKQEDFALTRQTKNWSSNFYNRAQTAFDLNKNMPGMYVANNMAGCSDASSQQPNNICFTEYTNANSSNIHAAPCSNSSDIVNSQHRNHTYAPNYSKSNIHNNTSNALPIASTAIDGNEQPITAYTQYAMNATSSKNMHVIPNVSGNILNSQQPNTSYSQYAMNATSSNMRVIPNVCGNILNSQQPNTSYSQYATNATSSKRQVMPNLSSNTLNTQQPNTSYSQYATNATSSKRQVMPNLSSNTLNIRQPNTSYSQYAMNASSCNRQVMPNISTSIVNSQQPSQMLPMLPMNVPNSNQSRNALSSNTTGNISNSQQINTNYSQYPGKAKGPMKRAATHSNASSSHLYIQNPNANYLQYSKNVTSTNTQVSQSINVSSNISNSQHPQTSSSQYAITATASNTAALPKLSNIAPQLSNTAYNYNNYPNNSNTADVQSSKSQNQADETNNKTQNTQTSNQEQFVIMHTVELPNKKTNSPFRYFQELLQIHNIKLLNKVDDAMLKTMSCLIKFKLLFEQENTARMTLCLAMFYCRDTFYVKVADVDANVLDIPMLSAYWQWEILKEFKGDVVTKLYENASKLSPEVLNKTTYFVTLLANIVCKK